MSKIADAITDMFASVSLGAPDNAVGFVLWRVVHRYQREIDRVLAPVDLTHLQFTMLAMAAWLAKSGEPVTQSTLSRAGDIHQMQVSHMLKALEAKGMITRVRSPADVRAKLVEISDKGVGALRDAMPLVVAVQQRMFGAEGGVGGRFLATLHAIEDANRS